MVAAYGIKHGFKGISAGGFKPTYQSFVLLVPLILFSLVGFELPSAAGEEMEDAKEDVPAGIAKSVIATTLLYGLPVLGILLILPTGQATGLAGFPDAIKQTLTVFGGHTSPAAGGLVTSHLSSFGTVLGWIMAGLIAIVAFTSGLTWIMGSDRTLAVSCYDGAGPKYFGGFSARFGTPLRVNVLSGVISTGIFVATLYITSGNAAKFFNVALALAISTTLISYLGIFPAAWKLRKQRPDDGSYRAPMLPLMTILSLAFVVFSSVEVLFPGLGDDWFGSSYRPDDWKPSEKWIYTLTEAVPLVLFLAIAVAFWAMGKRHRDAELDHLGDGVAPVAAPSRRIESSERCIPRWPTRHRRRSGSTRRRDPSPRRRSLARPGPTWSSSAAATPGCGPRCWPRRPTRRVTSCCSTRGPAGGRRPGATAGSARRA